VLAEQLRLVVARPEFAAKRAPDQSQPTNSTALWHSLPTTALSRQSCFAWLELEDLPLLGGEPVQAALMTGDFSPARFATYGANMRQGIENMRKLVYAFYDPKFSFREVVDKAPELGGDITDCLSGDVNKDLSRLWQAIEEFVPLPEALPLGAPLQAAQAITR
jgi:hypothetical protein